ncbi:hypothetical protein dqs_2399 [Azoarcus olearius]|uniref:NfeD family protein n=1 Tax=Azoarcus sp. (strain BH72) TaxID=418699 RepID=UPI000806409E|nr:NfeD family protein [Azoarcus olearius]ANQ85430.1 hypothetical protein dqs_2399 [Azoarcus olearius]
MSMEWWHWAVGGIALILLELVIPAFFVVWFGLGALLVALVALVADLSLTAQLVLWLLASVAMTVLWFKVFEHRRHKTLSGTAEGDVIGEVGLLVGAIEAYGRGKVRFQRPVLGADEWICLAETAIPAGERVRVVGIEGSFLRVTRA